jgi:hypothetical protein
MGETYKCFKIPGWYTVANGLALGFINGAIAECVAAYYNIDLEMIGFAHTSDRE